MARRKAVIESAGATQRMPSIEGALGGDQLPVLRLSRQDGGIMLCLTGVVLGVFLNSLNGEFVHWDDYPNYVENSNIRELNAGSIRWMVSSHLMGVWQPLTWLVTAIEYQLFGRGGMQSFRSGMQFVSIGLHVIAVLLWYVVSLRLISLALLEPARKCPGAMRAGAIVAALWFAVHPQRVEVVGWASGQPYLLAAVWCLACVLCYINAATRPNRRRLWLSLAVLCYAGSLLCKAIAVPLVAALVILDFYPLRRIGGAAGWGAPTIRRLLLEKIPFVLLTAAAMWLAVWATDQNKSYRPDPESVRILITTYCIVFYAVLTFIPIGIAPYYARPQPIVSVTSNPWFIGAFAAVIAVTILVVVLARRRPWPAAVWLIYVAFILPVAGYVRHGGQLAADRYSYLGSLPWLALIGGLIAVAMASRREGQVRKLASAATAVLCIATIGAFSVMTWRQSGVWHDSIRLWQSMIDRNPNWQMGYYNLAKRYKANNDLAEAERLYRRAIEIWPRYPEANVDLGNMLFSRGDLEGAKKHYELSLRGRRDFHMAHYNLGRVYAKRKDYSAAYDHFKKAEADAAKTDRTKLGLIRSQLKSTEAKLMGAAPPTSDAR